MKSGLRLGIVVILLISASTAVGRPSGDDWGWKYYARLHEQALYNTTVIYSRTSPRRYWWADGYLQEISHARYEAIDLPVRSSLIDALHEAAADNGFSVISSRAHTGGDLRVAFEPNGQPNTLEFEVSGLTVEAHARFKKSWYLEGWAHAYIDNIAIFGEFNYFTGDVTVSTFSAPVRADADVDLNIPIIGQLLDFLVDAFVDDYVDDNLPANLNELFMGGDIYSTDIGGIEDAIPLGELIYNGIDYGVVIRDELSTASIINDNFSFAVGGIVVHDQYFDITVGNVTYKRYTTGGRELCQMFVDPDCDF